MKVRNKLTGEIRDFDFVAITKDKDALLARIADNIPVLCCRSIEQLNSEWDDYKPAEPLIKDEKVRKAIRAWYEAIPMDDIYYKRILFRKGYFCVGVCVIDCGNYGALKDIKERFYTIKELCGEEEC